MDVEKTIEFILNMQAKAEAEMEQFRADTIARAAEHDRAIERIDTRLDRAVRLGVRFARQERAERKKSQEAFDRRMEAFDQRMDRLSAAQDRTDEALRQFIESMKRGGNGSH